MKQFALMDGYTKLHSQLQDTQCLIFKDQELPPSCTPSKARMGFELQNGAPKVLIDKGITYHGSNSLLVKLFREGHLVFDSVEDMRDWFMGEVRREFEQPAINIAPGLSIEDLRERAEEASHYVQTPNQISIDVKDLVSELASEVIGQDQALQVIAGRVARHLARKTPTRPSTLFLLGPTGVGKTKAASILPKAILNVTDSACRYQFVRLDMCEYQEAHRVSQLLGSPQGYIGHGEESQLLRALRTNPRTIVLLDEIEKAHSDIFTTLMNAMDNGRLSSASATGGSYEVDCRSAIFIFTSNLNAGGILQAVDGTDGRDEQGLCRRHLVTAGIPPELAARISAFAVFRDIDAQSRMHILGQAMTKVAAEYGLLVVDIEPQALAEMAVQQEQRFGVRVDEYLIDDVLGQDFIAMSGQGIQRVVVKANPLRVEQEEVASVV